MNPITHIQQRGFVALTSIIIISAVLLLMATTAGLSGWYTRSNIVDTELKSRSATAAEACVDEARLLLAKNPRYAGSSTIAIGDASCVIGDITTSGIQKSFNTLANYRNMYTRLHITLDANDLSLVSWEEIP